MLEPGQFETNEAWIVFRLNEAPISTKTDGDFNVLCLMDAASCFILGNEFVPTHAVGIPESVSKRLIETARSKTHVLPQKLLLPSVLESRELAEVARQFDIKMMQVPEDQLSPFTSEAKEEFLTFIGGGRVQ